MVIPEETGSLRGKFCLHEKLKYTKKLTGEEEVAGEIAGAMAIASVGVGI